MALENTKKGNYLSIIGGKIKKQVAKGTEGAIERTYKTKDGNEGVKYELEYDNLSGKISKIAFYDGEYGKQLSVSVKDDKTYTLQLNASQSYGEDLMRKLPNIDLNKEVKLSPFDFEDDKGKIRQGITVYQDNEKIQNFFVEVSKDDKGNNVYKNVNGYPEPDGDKSEYDSDDWKAYYIKARKFVIAYITENVIPKLSDESSQDTGKVEYPEEEINPEDIPF